ncbi:MAG: EamA family transporter [Hyphomicrobiales bacterium]|nr:EamA family transporter [Hyphomicrobiales bacterium]MBV9590120.1 EamA family transporter [Hyphomicrobiales bacterium]
MSLFLVFWFALSVMCDVCGQLCFKIGADRLPSGRSPIGISRAVLSSPWLVTGLCVYAIETIVWTRILSDVPLSIAYPIASLNFLGVTLASATILGERVGRPQWMGAWLVTFGVAIVAGSA